MLENKRCEFGVLCIIDDLKIGYRCHKAEIGVHNECRRQETASPTNRPVRVCKVGQVANRHIHDVHADIAVDNRPGRHIMPRGCGTKVPDRRFAIFKIAVAGAEARAIENRQALGFDIAVLRGKEGSVRVP